MTIQQIFDTDIPKDQFIIVSAGQALLANKTEISLRLEIKK